MIRFYTCLRHAGWARKPAALWTLRIWFIRLRARRFT
jgi:hypothetical protein